MYVKEIIYKKRKKKGLEVHIWLGSCIDYDAGLRKKQKTN
jgi:hypothetical protein